MATKAPKNLSIKPLVPLLGALVENVDLACDHDDATVATIAGALETHLVLSFENQTFSPEQQPDFARRFGDLYTHPLYPGQAGLPEIMVLGYDADRRGHNDVRRTGVTYIATLPKASLLMEIRSRAAVRLR